MDRRSILFVLILTAAMFGVNAFFTYLDQDRNKEWYEQQKVAREKKKQELLSDISKNKVAVEQLPLAAVYFDADKKESAGLAIRQNGTLLVIMDREAAPKEIYSDEGSLPLLSDNLQQSGLALYGKGDTKALPFLALPELGVYPVQLYFPIDAQYQGLETPGDYQDGQIILPLNQLGKEFPDEYHAKMPKTTGFVFAQKDKNWVPAGIYLSHYNAFAPFDKIEGLNRYFQMERQTAVVKGKKGEEKFYVLENGTQQLVFSNYGGALVEINLPFQGETHPKSVVKEIDFDRDMVKYHAENAMFPSHPYYKAGSNEQQKGVLGGYYPLLRRDLIERPPFKTIRLQPAYYAFNIVSEYPELAELEYEVKEFTDKKIVFEGVQPHRRITKTFEFAGSDAEAPYTVNLTVKVEGDSRGLWLSTGIPEVEWISGAIAPALKYRVTVNKKPKVESLNLPQDPVTVTSIKPDWLCNSNGFLGMILDPLSEVDPGYKAIQVSGVTVPSRLTEIDQEYERFKAAEMPGYNLFLPLKNNGGTMSFRIFAGPFADSVLKTVDGTFSDPATGYNPDYIACQTSHGIFTFISEPFAQFLLILMKFFHSLTNSWALSIILLTVVLRIILYPLNTWSMKSMIKMQQVAPEVTALQERYKKDPKKMQLEVANLYRERGVNPFSGCLPLLIQLPFLVGMFDLLKSTFELRGASFIPGWIDNLAAPDVLFSWHYPIFFIGTEFHLLPILFAVVMFIQQRMSSTVPTDPKLMTDQQRQQKAMGNIMTIVFAIMFYHVPSGLNIYWISSLLLGILQQWWTQRSMKSAAAKVEVVKPAVKKAR